MNDVGAVSGLASSSTLREFADQSSRQAGRADASAQAADRVEISELASFLNRLAELPEDRARKIVNVRNAIADGSYETPEKLDLAVEALLKSF